MLSDNPLKRNQFTYPYGYSNRKKQTIDSNNSSRISNTEYIPKYVKVINNDIEDINNLNPEESQKLEKSINIIDKEFKQQKIINNNNKNNNNNSNNNKNNNNNNHNKNNNHINNSQPSSLQQTQQSPLKQVKKHKNKIIINQKLLLNPRFQIKQDKSYMNTIDKQKHNTNQLLQNNIITNNKLIKKQYLQDYLQKYEYLRQSPLQPQFPCEIQELNVKRNSLLSKLNRLTNNNNNNHQANKNNNNSAYFTNNYNKLCNKSNSLSLIQQHQNKSYQYSSNINNNMIIDPQTYTYTNYFINKNNINNNINNTHSNNNIENMNLSRSRFTSHNQFSLHHNDNNKQIKRPNSTFQYYNNNKNNQDNNNNKITGKIIYINPNNIKNNQFNNISEFKTTSKDLFGDSLANISKLNCINNSNRNSPSLIRRFNCNNVNIKNNNNDFQIQNKLKTKQLQNRLKFSSKHNQRSDNQLQTQNHPMQSLQKSSQITSNQYNMNINMNRSKQLGSLINPNKINKLKEQINQIANKNNKSKQKQRQITFNNNNVDQNSKNNSNNNNNKSNNSNNSNKKQIKQNKIKLQLNYQTSFFQLNSIIQKYSCQYQNYHLAFKIPKIFLSPQLFSPSGSKSQLYQSCHLLFSTLSIPSTNLSIKKYPNCLHLITSPNKNNNIIIIWYYSGKRYLGGWKYQYLDQGVKDGIGLEYNPNQYIYYGQWKNNMKNGIAAMKEKNGNVKVGQWSNNQYIGMKNKFNIIKDNQLKQDNMHQQYYQQQQYRNYNHNYKQSQYQSSPQQQYEQNQSHQQQQEQSFIYQHQTSGEYN